MINRLSDYSQHITTLSSKKDVLLRNQKPLPILRLTMFLGLLFVLYTFLTTQTIWAASLAILVFILFVTLSLYDSRLKKQIKEVETLIGINQNEVTALNGDFGGFNSGTEFVDQSHDYTHDLDIFGEGSIFQYLNRTATIFGKLKLADYLGKAFNYSNQIIPRQQAISELAELVEERQNLQVMFNEQQISISDKTEIDTWLKSDSPVLNLKLLKMIAFILPSITILCISLSLIGIISFPGFLIVLQWMIVILYARQTMRVQTIITSKSKILNKYALCLELIENTKFDSDYFKDLQRQMVVNHKDSPSRSIFQLSRILNYMDQNLNILVSVILNGLFMFNLHLLLKVEKWKKQNQQNVPSWFDAIATFDALCSLANYAYNHPDFTTPVPVKEDFLFSAENLAHPLIPEKTRVKNDLEIKGWNQFSIITGANMSGKSTFLRTIGVNYILAMAGAPVCASKLSFFPIQIHSSIRTSDSLTRNESYFYAELKRLKQIIDELKVGKKRLILLDEILKGTNSKDKQSGSIALIEQLLHYQSVGLFATHDLILGELHERFPEQVNNLCFEIEIAGDKMVIDYKLHKGVCKNLNATYLMKNMGILLNEEDLPIL